MAPRAYWKGFLRLSLVSCPIQLFPATSEREKVSFNQINAETGNRIRYRKVDEHSGEEVEQQNIVKAYQVEKGHYIEISDEELDARPELVKTMSVQPPRGAGRVRLLRIPGIDLQPCGGTHVRNIAEIGAIRVLRIRSEGRRNRRVEIALEGTRPA